MLVVGDGTTVSGIKTDLKPHNPLAMTDPTSALPPPSLPQPSLPQPSLKNALGPLLQRIAPHHPAPPEASACLWRPGAEPGEGQLRYANCEAKRGIDFSVEDNPFAAAEVLDPRVVRIAPGACNEKHRHAHEALFVVLEGMAEIQIGDQTHGLQRGAVAFVPRWVVHQTRNPSQEQPLVLLAITDFGLTSTVLGDYDSRTRLRHNGEDVA